jgi:alanyl-tRNA synthetase
MLDDKQLKEKYKTVFSKNPENYPIKAIKSLGMKRGQCKCGRFFWAVDSNTCGDPECTGGYTFGDKQKKGIDYINLWKKLCKHLPDYTPIKRYPVVARWRDDLFFVEASIDNFIPFVVNGIADPPANPLLVPQICMRFNDLDNVGITGAHYSGFVMVGQHRFERTGYDFNKYLLDLWEWFEKGLNLKPEHVILHEDVWVGSGNFGPCIEFFSGGLELANQVYMQYTETEKGKRDLALKVLDMGLGYERNVWFSQGASTSYETTFPTVVKILKQKTGIKVNDKIVKDFLPYSSLLNLDEIENAGKVWKEIAAKLGLDVKELTQAIIPLSGIYAIADHTRSLLFAITDGALPSNVGGGYNLRVMLRRCFSIMNRYNWEIDIVRVMEEHAKYLRLFPGLGADKMEEIIAIEKDRYDALKKKARLISGKSFSEQKLIELYDSQGISPEMIGAKIPEDFYSKVAERHEHEKKERIGLDLSEFPETKGLYYDSGGFDAKVLGEKDGWFVLDRTAFYPEGGGQECDLGTIDGKRVLDVQRFGNVIGHKVDGKISGVVKGVVDMERRTQLKQHHTAVHLINTGSRKILGNHVWQAGAGKSVEKAHLDITHYKGLTDKETKAIEKLANIYVKKGLDIEKSFMERSEAEKKYGMRLYQGGAVPGKEIRVVKINDIDVEACGGLHLDNTKDVGKIYVTGSERIQDGVVRINIVAGDAAEQYENKMTAIYDELQKLVGKGTMGSTDVVKGVKLIFEKWKRARREKEKSSKEKAKELAEKLENNKDIIIAEFDGNNKDAQALSRYLTRKGRLLILFAVDDKVHTFVSSQTDAKAGEIVKYICKKLGGKGGGTPALGQGIGNKDKLKDVIKELRDKYE